MPFQVKKLEDKLEHYKFGLPTLLIASEQEVYRSNAEEINAVSQSYFGINNSNIFCLVKLENQSPTRKFFSTKEFQRFSGTGSIERQYWGSFSQ